MSSNTFKLRELKRIISYFDENNIATLNFSERQLKALFFYKFTIVTEKELFQFIKGGYKPLLSLSGFTYYKALVNVYNNFFTLKNQEPSYTKEALLDFIQWCIVYEIATTNTIEETVIAEFYFDFYETLSNKYGLE